MGRSLMVVLTNLGDNPINRFDRGAMRLNTAVTEARKIRSADIMISGGQRPDFNQTEASLLYEYHSATLKRLAKEDGIETYLQAEGRCTVDDMLALADWLKRKSYTTIYVSSHPTHSELAIRTLKSTGVEAKFRVLDSGEQLVYTAVELAILRFLSVVDPFWQTPLSWPLRLIVSRRGH